MPVTVIVAGSLAVVKQSSGASAVQHTCAACMHAHDALTGYQLKLLSGNAMHACLRTSWPLSSNLEPSGAGVVETKLDLSIIHSQRTEVMPISCESRSLINGVGGCVMQSDSTKMVCLMSLVLTPFTSL